MSSRYNMPDPRIITDYTPACFQEEILKARLGAPDEKSYRAVLQKRGLDVIKDNSETVQERVDQFRAAFLQRSPSEIPRRSL